jgi:hypothetical protein
MSGEKATPAAVPPDRESETTGLPGLRRWPAVYAVVLGIFLLWVGLLTWLTEHYS